MTTDLAAVGQLHNPSELQQRDREAAQAVAAGLADAKAENTRRAYGSAWRGFQDWAEAGGHPALPATPQAVALYLGHLAATGRPSAVSAGPLRHLPLPCPPRGFGRRRIPPCTQLWPKP